MPRLADVLELRAADPQQRAMLEGYLDELPLPPRARVLEIGCGPGPIARALAARANIAEVVGIDPCNRFGDAAVRHRLVGAQLDLGLRVAPRLAYCTGSSPAFMRSRRSRRAMISAASSAETAVLVSSAIAFSSLRTAVGMVRTPLFLRMR